MAKDWADIIAGSIYEDHKWDGDGSGIIATIAEALRAYRNESAADAELGRMVRETVRKLRVIMVGVTPQGYGVYANGAMQSEKMNTLDEAVRRALEAQ